MTELVGDLLTLAVMPLPLIAAALLYFDLRKRRDGLRRRRRCARRWSPLRR